MIVIEVIPYKDFKERIRVIKELLKKKEKITIEVYENYIYVEVQRGKTDVCMV
ncbi:hypothetical protein M2651_05735 [Clostridium sp. SYSU_GA19001]|uniref:hypothetical protein n=1 Tax=Clostridium caldaquaticum TaxID=2940653 RepID=UPI0020779383|nr:hypothetical protein [Clostridium caldaquaticum]MCM8710526.1 hypothetical protein [Clostridium caldaquaticum]